MHRREFLRLAGLGSVGTASAGCLGGAPRAGVGSLDSDQEPDLRAAEHGFPPDVCEQPIKPNSGIYAILEPAFDSNWSGREIGVEYRYYRGEPRLADEQTVIGVTWGGRARAYPISVLLYHEVVNDTASEPLLVTYCPLCSSGMVASRRVAGETTRFAVSGQLWIPERIFAAASEQAGRSFGASYGGGETVDIRPNGNLVLYDAATQSYWSQILAHAICGPRAGTDLAIRSSTVATWADWRDDHPDTDVLLPPPYSTTIDPGVVLGDD